MGIFDKVKMVADIATAGNQLLNSFLSQDEEDDEYDEEEDDDEYDEEEEEEYEEEKSTRRKKSIKNRSQNEKQITATNVTSGMYDASLEKLIDIALADGVLTEKERKVLFKKAESLGIDLDEFEMVLEARMGVEQNEKEIVVAESLTSYTSINKLLKMLDDAEKEIRNRKIKRKTKTSFSLEDSIGGAFDGLLSNGVSGAVRGAVNGGLSIDDEVPDIEPEITERKKQIILNFPIPNTKDEIVEFLTYVIPLAKKKGNFFTENEHIEHNRFVPIWKTKCEQIITKVRLSMRNDRQLMNVVIQCAVDLGIKK
jgi:hypothetical protein